MAQRKTYSPVDDARFKAGIPWWGEAFTSPVAMVLGLYDIHYDSRSLSLSGGTNDDLLTIIEEVSHAVQFLNVWAGLKNGPLYDKYGIDTTQYKHAQSSWQTRYATSAIVAGGYDHDIEKWGKKRDYHHYEAGR